TLEGCTRVLFSTLQNIGATCHKMLDKFIDYVHLKMLFCSYFAHCYT
uniref:Uncharacterized protein n=1 Tax=Falco tinnunculus TaxID=100819 RepID=A0A8C4U8V5_FALTI